MKSISKSIPVVATACDCEVLAGGGGGGGGMEAECCAIWGWLLLWLIEVEAVEEEQEATPEVSEVVAEKRPDVKSSVAQLMSELTGL